MKTFNNVTQMKLANLTPNQLVETKGQTSDNDGLGVRFYITTTGSVSGEDIVLIANGNYASTVIGATRFNASPEMWNGTIWVGI